MDVGVLVLALLRPLGLPLLAFVVQSCDVQLIWEFWHLSLDVFVNQNVRGGSIESLGVVVVFLGLEEELIVIGHFGL